MGVWRALRVVQSIVSLWLIQFIQSTHRLMNLCVYIATAVRSYALILMRHLKTHQLDLNKAGLILKSEEIRHLEELRPQLSHLLFNRGDMLRLVYLKAPLAKA